MAERIRMRIRALVVIDIIPDSTTPPASSNGGTSSTPGTAQGGSSSYRQPPPTSSYVSPATYTHVARQLDALTNGYWQFNGVDPSQSSN